METYEEKYKDLVKRLNKAREEKGVYTFNSVLDAVAPELKESEDEDERIRKELIEFVKSRGGFKQEYIAWLEKQGQGEQKPTDKVEPKFKVGDWVVNRFGDVWHIDSFDKKNYQVSNQVYNGNKYNYFPIYKQNEMHLWTIADAKDGDILATQDHILIFEKFLPNDGGVSYCHYDFGCSTPQFNFNKDDNWYFGKEAKVYPATKEQRDTLMKAMADAGYTFDFESKELKKIEQKPDWSEEDEKTLSGLIISLARIGASTRTDSTSVNYTFAKEIDWLKSLKDRVQPKQEWSEEDESRMENLCHFLKEYGNQYYGALTLEGTINWLKSLRPQSQWKPSDEQLYTLEKATHIVGSKYKSCLNSLYSDLIKLREK